MVHMSFNMTIPINIVRHAKPSPSPSKASSDYVSLEEYLVTHVSYKNIREDWFKRKRDEEGF